MCIAGMGYHQSLQAETTGKLKLLTEGTQVKYLQVPHSEKLLL